jgi:hypothetical protein
MSDIYPMRYQENQRRLMAAVKQMGVAVEALLGRPEKAPELEPEEPPAALEALCAIFGLSTFERNILLLCAGVELDSVIASLCAGRPTFSMALAAFQEAHWSALSPSRPLRYWRLIDVMPGDALTTSPLRIDERVLHYLTGVQAIDERLRPILKRVTAAAVLAPSQAAAAEEVAAVWARANGQRLPVIQLNGADMAAKRDVAAAAANSHGLELRRIGARQLPHTTPETDLFLRLWDREAALSPSALLIECDEDDIPEVVLGSIGGALFVSTRTPRPCGDRPVALFELNPPLAQEQHELWRSALGNLSGLNGTAAELSSQFNFSPATIHFVAGATEAEAGGTADRAVERLWDACRRHARPRLEGLAQRIDAAATWEDLVLPERQTQMLRQVVIHVRQRAKVYQAWGFAGKGTRGLGISALFAGPSGTGKTMAAEVLANDLCLDLYRIDLSQVVNKYIGETEKNLRRVFDAAEQGAAVLLFDEADALFGKRSDVKDSHDRYANIEVSYLLQRMETYRGLAILTTNRKSALDQAFLRRIRFVVEFPFPGAEQRGEIWRHIFPAATPLDGLCIDRLARLNATGGHIRNIAMGAAFLAADAGEPVRMSHLLSAAHSEFAKMERPLTDMEVAGWV